jgi:hypothetical protein
MKKEKDEILLIKLPTIQYNKLIIRGITLFFLTLNLGVNLSTSQVIQLSPEDDLQSAIDAINTNDMQGDILVELAGGRYEISQTLN